MHQGISSDGSVAAIKLLFACLIIFLSLILQIQQRVRVKKAAESTKVIRLKNYSIPRHNPTEPQVDHAVTLHLHQFLKRRRSFYALHSIN